MNTEINKKYCDVLLKAGVNLYPGQNLNINCSIYSYEFALLIAERAYEIGAKLVNIDVSSNEHVKSRIKHCQDSYLDFVPSFSVAKSTEMIADDWAFLSFDNTEEQDVLAGADGKKLSAIMKAYRKNRRIFRDNLMKDKIAWCVAAYPGKKWAKKVVGEESVEKLWEVLIPILKLNEDDPYSAWMKSADLKEKRASTLNKYKIKSLHFEGSGTDLKIGLNDKSRWVGAYSETLDGRKFLPNIPSEEIFTTPDYRKTEGKVKVTKPLKVMESMVEGAWFVFEGGKVVEFGAEKGKDVLENYLKLDDGASFLGEVALVDSSSSIFKSGKLFGSILYDENAASHIALGSGYPTAFSNSNELNSDEVKMKEGCNVSFVHTDFMIGSDDMNVTGYDGNDTKIKIIENGRFQI